MTSLHQEDISNHKSTENHTCILCKGQNKLSGEEEDNLQCEDSIIELSKFRETLYLISNDIASGIYPDSRLAKEEFKSSSKDWLHSIKSLQDVNHIDEASNTSPKLTFKNSG